jgi:hypothetical protein
VLASAKFATDRITDVDLAPEMLIKRYGDLNLRKKCV